MLVNTGTYVFSLSHLIMFFSNILSHHSSFYNILYLCYLLYLLVPLFLFIFFTYLYPPFRPPVHTASHIALHFQPLLYISHFKPCPPTSCPLQNLVNIAHVYPKLYSLITFIIIFYPSVGNIMKLCMPLLNCVNVCAL
jgi:hypothetical protein